MTFFSILTGSDVTKVKSEVTIVFSGKFYITYQKGIETGHLEATIHSLHRTVPRVYDHITLNTPVLVRSPKLSNVEPGWVTAWEYQVP